MVKGLAVPAARTASCSGACSSSSSPSSSFASVRLPAAAARVARRGDKLRNGGGSSSGSGGSPGRRLLGVRVGAVPLHGAVDALESLRHAAVLGLEPLYMPCSGLKCGDIVYRSTLDPVLRLEERAVNPYSIALGVGVAAYLFSTPGILPGFLDYYFLAPLFSLFRKKVRASDISLGRTIGTGGFGRVYRATLENGGGTATTDIVVKKAYEYGEAEAWMNERLERVCPNRVPKFMDAFEGPAEKKNQRPPLWLVWQFEGEGTLADAIQERNFPENLEKPFFGESLSGRSLEESRRRGLVIRRVLKEVLDAISDIHATGIVHRDVKPQNILLPSSKSKTSKLKFIDFGAAADLRIGINYLPKEFLLDPRYAPPEKYIMSTSTPKAPPTPVAAALSPVLWTLNRPDRFDMYSVGILLVQMCFPSLRRDNQLIAFNRQLEKLDYDILKWRDVIASKGSSFREGIDILDMDGGRGWDLLRLLINGTPSKRISASAAALHPFVSNNGLGVVPVLLEQVGDMFPEDIQRQSEWLADKMAKEANLGLTEAKVEDIRLRNKSRSVREREMQQLFDPKSSRTVAWWQGRGRRREAEAESASKVLKRRKETNLKDNKKSKMMMMKKKQQKQKQKGQQERSQRLFNAWQWKAQKTVSSLTKKGGSPFASLFEGLLQRGSTG